jgi:hypothetical protein
LGRAAVPARLSPPSRNSAACKKGAGVTKTHCFLAALVHFHAVQMNKLTNLP